MLVMNENGMLSQGSYEKMDVEIDIYFSILSAYMLSRMYCSTFRYLLPLMPRTHDRVF